MSKSKYDVQVNPDLCTGCLRCGLACSELYTGAFNPLLARIHVKVSGATCEILFTEECNACGVCADNCFFEALTKTRKEAQA
ncbi:MAG: 4Fe-4S binding protein [Deltaproteobacteria bacterium]|nr:4Fe-4S binding protein [Deltaproteobacteria bacterium]MBW1923809.1 4Fe-4S binding protein [Deltaproteobacteria bacterium]MBW1949313.1 4Fe-4S binding protein [Deltaproteobacteria bacterium]MBW2009107.1 4Fe-4S binding protein [Deltaproteobacteria bacterium]MBW2103782.1 4Fe-4S binding protein [Deltaproteobacteria bacterium]